MSGHSSQVPSGWTGTTGASGQPKVKIINSGNADFGGTNAPSGTGNYVGLQIGGCYMQQDVTGLTAGTTYTVSFQAAARSNHINSVGIPIKVFLNGAEIGSVTTTNNFAANALSLAAVAGSNVLKFQNGDTSGADKTVFLDDVVVAQATEIVHLLHL